MKNEVVKNMFWRFAETIGAQVVSFIVSIVLARLLAPDDYGVIAIIIIFINIANVFAESGLGTALIQKKVVDNKDFSTIFYFNIIFSVFIYLVLFSIAPIVADFYNNTFITLLLRVLGIRIIFSSVNSVQKAYVSKTLQFKRFFFSTITGTIFSAILGIGLAYSGAGAWSLVAQYLSNVIIDTVVLWFTVKWRPGLYFSFDRLKVLLSYGIKILFTSLINEIFIQSKSLIIGKVYTASDLAYFNKGQQFPATITNGIGTAINSVMFPVMSKNQDSIERVKQMLRKTLSNLSLFLTFSMFFLATIAPSLIPLLMTERWSGCIIYLQIAAINNIFVLLQSTYTESFKAIGCVNLFMKISLIHKVLNICMIILFMFRGPLSMLLGELIVSFFILMLITYSAVRKLKYQLKEQIKDSIKVFIISMITAIIVIVFNYTISNYFYRIVIQSVMYICLFIFLSYISKYNLPIYYIKTIFIKFKLYFNQ